MKKAILYKKYAYSGWSKRRWKPLI